MSVKQKRTVYLLLIYVISVAREIPPAVPKQKKKAQQYKGQKKSESSLLSSFPHSVGPHSGGVNLSTLSLIG